MTTQFIWTVNDEVLPKSKWDVEEAISAGGSYSCTIELSFFDYRSLVRPLVYLSSNQPKCINTLLEWGAGGLYGLQIKEENDTGWSFFTPDDGGSLGCPKEIRKNNKPIELTSSDTLVIKLKLIVPPNEEISHFFDFNLELIPTWLVSYE